MKTSLVAHRPTRSGVFIELPGRGTCFYRQHVNPGKPTLLLLHGMVASSGLNWFRQIPSLSRNFSIIAPDIRGHGRSWRATDRFTFERAAEDLALLLAELETGPIIAVGYSMGGAIAQYLWRAYPDLVDGLVLAATNYKARVARHEEAIVLPFFTTVVTFSRIVELFGHLPKGILRRIFPKLSSHLNPNETRWALDELRRTSMRTAIESGREMAFHDASEWINEIDVPTSVVITERDRAIPRQHQQEMAGRIDDVAIFYHDDGHLACIRKEFGEVLLEACNSVVHRCNKDSSTVSAC